MNWKDMAEEVAHHLRDQYAELRAAGLSHQDAMSTTAAEVAGVNPGDWPREIRHAARSLWKARGFSLTAILTLALGIGANAAIFSVVNAVVLRPLAYRDPDRLVVVWDNLVRHGLKDIVASAMEYTEFRDRNRVFDRMAAYDTKGFAWYQIVGIVGAIKHRALDAKELPELYVPYAQPLFAGSTVRPMFIVVRTDGDPLSMMATIRQTMAAVDPDQPVSDMRSVQLTTCSDD